MDFVSGFAMAGISPPRWVDTPVADQKDAGNAGFWTDLPQKGRETLIFEPSFSQFCRNSGALLAKPLQNKGFFFWGHFLERWLCKRDPW